MTDRGTFIINGCRSYNCKPTSLITGVFFGQSIHPNGITIFCSCYSVQGSWIEFTTDIRDVLWAYIDRKKIPATTLLRALGYSTDLDLLTLFELSEEIKFGTKPTCHQKFSREKTC